jgi:hypothetical protein
VKRIALLATVVAFLGLAPQQAQALALPCGLPSTQPLWFDFADTSVGFRMTVFGRSGLVLASAGLTGPAQLRSLGAQTVYWHMKLGRLVGTPTAPADSTTIAAAADGLFQKAVASSGCATPVIALNELNGVSRPTPWSYETTTYRQNILALVKALADKGAVPFLLIPGPPRGSRSPFLGNEARTWWLEVSKYAYLVRQMHFNAPFIYGMGPVVGARTRRVAMRHAVEGFIANGVPAERMGLLLGFQSGPGKGGREGLEPRASWFEIIKQDALAARQVTGELGLSSVWSWGWGTFDEAGADADKPAAACVYLWTRDTTLCDGLRAAGPRFNSSLTLGQISLPAGVQCKTGVGRITEAAVEQLETVTGNRQSALTALLNRLIYSHERVTVSSDEIDHVLTSLIERGFAGDSVAYQAALTQAGVTPPLARTLVADQLRRQEFEAIVQVRYGTSSPGGFREQRQRDLLRKTICLRDELPGPGVIDWAQEVPFLAVRPGSVSIRATRYQVRKGMPVVLSGRVESELPAEVVTVYGRKMGAGAFTTLGTARPDAGGRWNLRVKPSVGTTHYKAVSKSAASFAIVVRTRGAR